MRNGVLLFAGTFAAVLLGLLLNDYLAGRRQDQLLDKVHAESEATRHQLDRLSKDQEQIKRTLAQAGDSLASAQDKDSMLIRGDFAAAAASMRTAIAEYYMSTMKMPTGNQEVGLPAPDQYRGQSLVSATVAADGSIDFLFDAKSGVDGGRIRLIPDVSRANAMGIQWRCDARLRADQARVAELRIPFCQRAHCRTGSARHFDGGLMVHADLQIETERLLLRLPRIEDFEGYAELHADADAVRHIGGPLLRAPAWRKFLQMPGAWAVQGYAMFSVVEKASGRWIGQAGPWQPEGWPGTEVGWAFHRSAWGKGYATEAATAAIDWAFANLDWSEVIHSIDPGNAASQALAVRLGSVKRGPGKLPPPHEDVPIEIWGQSRAEWLARRKQGTPK